MILKQYAINLPAEYDMATIRKRVADKGPSYDGFPGLGIKIFMIRERGRHGARTNQYAPLYLWPAVAPIWTFIAGDGFRGIIESFGWTSIHYWLGFAYARKPGSDLAALRSVSREDRRIEAHTDLQVLRAGEIRQAREAMSTPGLLARAVGVDSDRWSLVRFNCWARTQDGLPSGADSYEALHVSAPGADQLQET